MAASGGVRHQQGSGDTVKVCLDRLDEELKRRAALLSTTGHRRPDALQPTSAACTSRALRDMSINHDKPDGLLRQVVGRLDARRGDESQVCLAMLPEPLGQVA